MVTSMCSSISFRVIVRKVFPSKILMSRSAMLRSERIVWRLRPFYFSVIVRYSSTDSTKSLSSRGSSPGGGSGFAMAYSVSSAHLVASNLRQMCVTFECHAFVHRLCRQRHTSCFFFRCEPLLSRCNFAMIHQLWLTSQIAIKKGT